MIVFLLLYLSSTYTDDDDDAGQVSGPQKMQHIVDRNQEVLNNFIKAIEELAILRDNLLKKEVCYTLGQVFIKVYQMYSDDHTFLSDEITANFELLFQ